MEQPEEVADAPDAPRASGSAQAVAEPERGSRGRRRGRTAALIGAAAALGLVAGTCAGYLVQVQREPTQLPSLSQPELAQVKGEGPEPLPAAQDRRVKTDGDLRKLLLRKPGGAMEVELLTGDDGWMDMATYAGNYEKPRTQFGELISDEFRRAAVTGWRVGTTYEVEIRLVQFRQEEHLAAAASVENNQYWAERRGGTDGWAVPGTGDGRAYSYADTGGGYLPPYTARAHAWRGDIAVEVWMSGRKPIPKKMIMDLAERQMERL